MENFINKTSITLRCPVEKVWAALTDPDVLKHWSKNLKMTGDWQIGSNITYTFVDAHQNPIKLFGEDYSWTGKVIKLVKNELIEIEYDGEMGLLKETYHFDSFNNEVKLSYTQVCSDSDSQEMFLENLEQTFSLLQDYLDNI